MRSLANVETSCQESSSKETSALTTSSTVLNGMRPDSMTYSTTPSPQRSTLFSYGKCCSTSGAAYSFDPTASCMVHISVAFSDRSLSRISSAFGEVRIAQRPKSHTLTLKVSASARRRFSGLRSRCTTPFAWMKASAWAMSWVICEAVSSLKAPAEWMRSKRCPPRASSMTSCTLSTESNTSTSSRM